MGKRRCSHSTENGNELTSYFNEYIGDINSNSNWKSCIVITDTIQPYEMDLQ